jgi:hypothetical protein
LIVNQLNANEALLLGSLHRGLQRAVIEAMQVRSRRPGAPLMHVFPRNTTESGSLAPALDLPQVYSK